MPTTKRKSPAQSPASTTKGTSVNAAVPSKPAGQTLPQSIDLIADAVSEMLTTGTTERSLERLLIAAIEHISRRTHIRGIGIDRAKDIRECVEREIGRYLQPWKDDIFAVWRHRRRETPAAIEPKTVAERIRQNARENLEDRLERFLGSATPEEVRFLIGVVETRDSLSSISPMAEQPFVILLGEAFEYELGRNNTYMAVPERLKDQAEKYVSALRAVEDRGRVGDTNEVPYWVKQTLPDHAYRLIMFENDDVGGEEIEMTRAEYISLKASLAAMRGYQVPAVEDALAVIREDEALESYSKFSDDDQQIARWLECARDFYRQVPDLVALVSSEFDAELEKTAE